MARICIGIQHSWGSFLGIPLCGGPPAEAMVCQHEAHGGPPDSPFCTGSDLSVTS